MAILGLSVPDGNYCWNEEIPKICTYFENEGGVPRCIIFPSADIILDNTKGTFIKYLRPKCCSDKLQAR